MDKFNLVVEIPEKPIKKNKSEKTINLDYEKISDLCLNGGSCIFSECKLFSTANKNVAPRRMQIKKDFADLKTKLLWVGEYPGVEELRQGKSFVGEMGKWVEKFIRERFKKEDYVEIVFTNAVRCYNYNIKAQITEINFCKHYLLEEIKLRDPDLIFALGNSACKALLDKTGITSFFGQWKKLEIAGRERIVYPTFLPAYVMKNPDKLSDFEWTVRQFAKLYYHGEPVKPELKYNFVKTIEEVKLVLEKFMSCEDPTLDIETNGLAWWIPEFKILSIAFSFEENMADFILLEHKENKIFSNKQVNWILKEIERCIKEKKKGYIVGHHILGYDIPCILNKRTRREVNYD